MNYKNRQKTINNVSDSDEYKYRKRICRVTVLRSMIDVLYFDLNGRIPADTETNKQALRRERDQAYKFLMSKRAEGWCGRACLPIEKVREYINIEGEAEKEAILIQLERAYDAISLSGMR